MKQLVFVLILFFFSSVHGQVNRAAHWYFGYEAGIDFSSGQPVVDTTGKLISIEGCSSISDASGDLLFYSNAEQIWNKNHEPMSNSQGLIGDQSSEQSSLIIPLPASDSLYYLFSTIGATNSGLRYSMIDMSLDGGLGAVTAAKNVLLHDTGTEELASTMHCNAVDYWIVSRQMDNDSLKFLSYLLTANGISGPVISKFYLPNNLGYIVGDLTFSTDGEILCLTILGKPIFIFDFDLHNGKLHFQQEIQPYENEQVYSNTFSPDASKLYTTSWGGSGNCYLSQYDLNASAARTNLDSADYSFGSPIGFGFIGQVNLAPDQRVYVSRWSQNGMPVNVNSFYTLDSLDVINHPDLAGVSCNFQRNFLYLDHKPTQVGLPNVVSNFNSLETPTNQCGIFNAGLNSISGDMSVEISPNPFSMETTVRFNNYPKNATLIVCNSLGREVQRISNISEKEVKLYRGDLSNGVYFLYLLQNNQIVNTERLVVVH